MRELRASVRCLLLPLPFPFPFLHQSDPNQESRMPSKSVSSKEISTWIRSWMAGFSFDV
jgi:hypothetical protein